jgi:hypothetical protein
MTTSSIHHRPAAWVAAAAAVTAIAAGSVAVSLSRDAGQPTQPVEHSQVSVGHNAPQAFHYHPTTSGGRVMLGE